MVNGCRVIGLELDNQAARICSVGGELDNVSRTNRVMQERMEGTSGMEKKKKRHLIIEMSSQAT